MYITFDNQIGIVTNTTIDAYIVVFINDEGVNEVTSVPKHIAKTADKKCIMIANLKGKLPHKKWGDRWHQRYALLCHLRQKQ